MKVKELMQYDKVYETLLAEKPQPVTVMEVGQNHIYILLEEDDETVLRYEPEHLGWQIKDIEPIQLTAEILEANGFVVKNADYIFLIMDEIIVSFHFGKTLRITDTGKGLEIGHTIKEKWYAHELQHALRLCGLNELADNFKIDNDGTGNNTY